jgi:hypothetical protein
MEPSNGQSTTGFSLLNAGTITSRQPMIAALLSWSSGQALQFICSCWTVLNHDI